MSEFHPELSHKCRLANAEIEKLTRSNATLTKVVEELQRQLAELVKVVPHG